MKGHELCLKLTSALQGDKQIFLSFTNGEDFGKWMNKCKMASSLLDITNELFAVALDHCSYEIQYCGIQNNANRISVASDSWHVD